MHARSILSGMELESLRDLYIHELKDLYSAERQMIRNMPKMVKAATNKQLASAFRQHLDQTKRQAERLEQLLTSHSESTRGPKCEGMAGVLKEGDEMVSHDAEDEVRDAGLIAAAQRAEHYEIAGYGCARTYAELLGDTRGAKVLDSILREEAATDVKLTKLARSVINLKAKKAPEKVSKKQRNGGGKSASMAGSVTGAVKQMVKKVTG